MMVVEQTKILLREAREPWCLGQILALRRLGCTCEMLDGDALVKQYEYNGY